MTGRAIVVANGILPREDIVRSEISQCDFILAADGGANSLLGLGIVPDAVLGDFDSLLVDLPASVERVSAPSQEATDLEKSVIFLIGKGYADITLIGVTGGRLDHTFGALAVLCKYGLRLVDDIGYANCLEGPGSTTIQTTAGQTISLMPCGNVECVATIGLKWNLQSEDFDFARRDGTSNIAVDASVTISAKSGYLIVYVHNSNV